MRLRLSPIIIVIITCFVLSCSSNNTDPVTPPDAALDINPLIICETQNTNHNFPGIWTVTFNTETLTATVKPNREMSWHYSVLSIIDPPIITVNYWDPISETVHVSVTIKNTTYVAAFDVRLIIYTDDTGYRLKNADNWTGLWDIPEGFPINPFKAYAKTTTRRNFQAQASHTENLQIYCPDENYEIQFAIDASYPGNCEEPYKIDQFSQGTMYDVVGSSAWIYVSVYDWQDDVSEVTFDCEAITGTTGLHFSHDYGNIWKLELENNTGASHGMYNAIIYAKSSGSGLLDLIEIVQIEITETTTGVPYYPQLAGVISYPRNVYSLNCAGNLAFVGELDNGFTMVDLSDPVKPIVVGAFREWDSITNLIPHNGYLFGKRKHDELVIFDIANQFNPEIIEEYKSSHFSWSMKLQGDYAFFVDTSEHHENEFKACDISDIHAVEMVDIIELDGMLRPYWVIEGNYAYVRFWKTRPDVIYGFHIVDISDPLNLQLVGTFETEKFLEDIEVNGNYLYAVGGLSPDNLHVIDVSDPSNMNIVNTIDLINARPRYLELKDNYLYVMEWHDTLFVLDLVDPLNPNVTGTLPADSWLSFDFSGDVLCLRGYGIATVNTDDPSNPFIAGTIYEGDIMDFDIVGNNLFSAVSGHTGLGIFDITNAEEPELISDQFEWISSLDIQDDYAYLTIGRQLNVVNIADPANPYNVGVLDEFGQGHTELIFEDNAVYATASYFFGTDIIGGSFQRADVSDPYNPRMTGVIDYLESIDVAVSGTIAYVIGRGANQLFVVDLADPDELIVLHVFDFDISFVHIVDDYLYLCLRGGSWPPFAFKIFDISNPLARVEIGELRFKKDMKEMDISGNYAYVINSSGLSAIDISDPTNPTLVSTFGKPHSSYGGMNIKIKDNYAFIRYETDGIWIVKLWD